MRIVGNQDVLYEPPNHIGVHCAPMFPDLIPVDTSARPRPSSSTSWRCGCSSTGSSSARSCPSTPRVPSVDQSTSSRPARPRSSPPRRPGPSSTGSTSQRWWAFAREPLSDMPVDRLAQRVARRHHASALMGFGGERGPARGDRDRDVGRSRVPPPSGPRQAPVSRPKPRSTSRAPRPSVSMTRSLGVSPHRDP